MNFNFRHLSLLAALFLSTRLAHAATCDASTDCEAPGFNGTTSAGWITSSTRITNIKVLNSGSATANPNGSKYWVAATETDFGASTTNGTITASGTGTTQLANTNQTAGAGSTPSTQIGGLSVTGVLGGTNYWVYVQACPSTTALPNGAHCSAWTKVNASQTKTADYPTTVFAAPVKPTDSTTSSINIEPSVPSGDAGDIGNVVVTVNDSYHSLSQAITPFSFPTNNAPYTFTDADYTVGLGFYPNTKYSYTGHVEYPFTVAVPSPDQTVSGIWTVPVQPGALTLGTVTHCSVTLTAKNAAADPANPSYTPYKVCAVGPGGACPQAAIGGTGVKGDTKDFVFTGLTPGQAYTSNAQALVGDGSDATASGWNSSTVLSGPGFTTQSFGTPTGTATAVWKSSATYQVTNIDNTAGAITTYQIQINGVNGAAQAWAGGTTATETVTVDLTGLTPDTAYTVKIILNEATCNSNAFATATFTTTPFAPASGTLSDINPRAVHAVWTDPSANPSGTPYFVQLCTASDFSSGCQTATVPNRGLSNDFSGLLPETAYYGEVKAVTVGGGADSVYTLLGTTTTSNEAPVVSVPTFTLYTTSAALSVVATDNGGPSHLIYTWTVTASPGGAVTSFTPNGTNGASSTSFVFSPTGSYTVQVTVTDHDGTGLATSNSVTINSSQTPTIIQLSPFAPVVGRGQQVNPFTATVTDQFGITIAGASVNWSVPGPGGTVSPASGATTVYTAGNTVGTYTLTATDAGASTSTLITVQANTVTVTGTAPRVGTGGTMQFTAVVKTPGNQTISPTLSFAVSGCPLGNTIDSTSGLFSANGQPGTCTIMATTSFGDSGTTTVIVDPTIPSFVTPPSASVYLTSATLTVLGTAYTNDGGESALDYHWGVVSPTGVTVDFSANDNNLAKNTIATFHHAGLYTLRSTITDRVNHLSSQVDFPVTVSAVLEAITVSPDNVTIQAFNAQAFTASGLDQFSNATSAGNVVWSTSGGSISGAGVFSSPGLGNNITVRARNGSVTGSATVNVISFDVSSAYAYPVPFKSTRDTVVHFVNLGSQAEIRIYTTTGRKVFSIKLDQNTYDWDTKNSSGDKVASGVYFYFVESPEGKKDGKLIIIQ